MVQSLVQRQLGTQQQWLQKSHYQLLIRLVISNSCTVAYYTSHKHAWINFIKHITNWNLLSLSQCKALPVLTLYPSCLHTTLASLLSQLLWHTVPHTPLMQISTLPALSRGPPAKRTVPVMQCWAAAFYIKKLCYWCTVIATIGNR